MIHSLGRWMLSLALLAWLGVAWGGDAPAPATAPADDGKVTCPECNGEGVAKCEAKGCVRGKVPCPKPCLKKTDTWIEMKQPDQPQVHRWQKVFSTDHTTSKLFPDTAIGHLIGYDGNGVPQDAGVCPDCRGTGVVDCPVCHGTGKVPCELCNGEKTVTKETAKDYIAKRDAERAARAIVLKDGTTIYGKVVTRMPDKVMIKTDEGKMVDVAPDQIVSEPPPEKKAPKKKDEPKK